MTENVMFDSQWQTLVGGITDLLVEHANAKREFIEIIPGISQVKELRRDRDTKVQILIAMYNTRTQAQKDAVKTAVADLASCTLCISLPKINVAIIEGQRKDWGRGGKLLGTNTERTFGTNNERITLNYLY